MKTSRTDNSNEQSRTVTDALLEEQEAFIESLGGWSQCHSCEFTHGDGTCRFFPDGKPLEIVSDEVLCLIPKTQKNRYNQT